MGPDSGFSTWALFRLNLSMPGLLSFSEGLEQRIRLTRSSVSAEAIMA